MKFISRCRNLNLALLLQLVWLATTLRATEVVIDAGQTNGFIRPLHGVNLGPLCYRGMVGLSAYHRELGVPLTRLHDVVWVNADAVDISTIFRDFRNDPSQPESYDFAITDDYIQAIIGVGSQIVYCLGESIEHTPRKYRVHPPSDPEKWARICLGIIRHYDEGWANGFQHRIRYWEIWNEPDIGPAMWTGTEEQFLQLFETAAKLIKTNFPNVKVGGPALGGTGDFVDGQFKPAPFFTRFLARCRAHEVPLDFLSWHRYAADAWDLPRRARAMRQVLDAHGFTNTESHLNEWNYLPREDWKPMSKEGQGKLREQWFDEMGGTTGAAFAACGLLLLQDAPIDAANFYTGEIQGFGLFNFHGVPKKPFYAFKAFKRLLDTPLRLAVSGGLPGRVAIAAGIRPDRSEIGILIAHTQPLDEPLDLTFPHLPRDGVIRCQIYAVDATHDLEMMQELELRANNLRLTQALKEPSVLLVKLRHDTSAR